MRRFGAGAALAVLLGAGPAQDDLVPGLIGEYYGMIEGMEDFPTLPADKKPAVRRVDKQVSFESTTDGFGGTELLDRFFVRWTGHLRIPKDGTYTLFAESDDGSRIWIDDKKVVDNGGLHPMEEKSGDVTLKAGDVPIKIELFENEGEAGIKVSWEADGISKSIIPEKAFFHKRDKDLDK